MYKRRNNVLLFYIENSINMKSFITIFSIAFAFFSAVSALPCETNCDHSSSETSSAFNAQQTGVSECVHGAYECQGFDVAQCNWGQWIVTECGKDTQCMPDDFECIPLDQWSALYSQIHPETTQTTESSSAFSAPLQTPEPMPCSVNGQFECQGNDVAQCNLGTWYVIPCANGTRCVPDDFECVPEDQYSAVFSQVHPTSSDSSSCTDMSSTDSSSTDSSSTDSSSTDSSSTDSSSTDSSSTDSSSCTSSTDSALAAPSPTAEPVACDTNGEFQCQGNDVAQCNIDTWNVITCPDNTKCMPDDFECVPVDQWQSVYDSIPHA